MNFAKSENQEMIAKMIRDFAEKEIRPHFMEWDETQEFPIDLFHKLGDLGLMGVYIPEEYGGSGMNYAEYITVVSEIAKVCGSIGLSVAAHNSLCSGHIYYHGSEEQKRKYLPKLATGEWIGAWGLTEAQTGSDAGGMHTTAVREGDFYVLNGSKNFITHGKSGNVCVVIARTGEMGDAHGMSAFIVEKGTPGFSPGKKENKLGMRASETAEIIFDNCKIPVENLIGKEGDGFIQAMQILDGGRISIGALALGIAQGAYDAAVKYAKEREQFGKAIIKHQAIGFKLADMATKIDAAELLLYRAAYLKDNHLPLNKESAMAKYYASEVAVEVADDAVQIFGGYGYIKDFPAEKYYRDAKLCTIGEGTSQIQQLVISREIMK